MSIDLSDLNLQISVLETELDSTQDLFKKYITDQTIPLTTRWEVFLHSPTYVKNTYSFNEYFPDELTDYFGFDILDELSESSGVLSITRLLKLSKDPIDVDKVKEAILKYNIGAFCA